MLNVVVLPVEKSSCKSIAFLTTKERVSITEPQAHQKKLHTHTQITTTPTLPTRTPCPRRRRHACHRAQRARRLATPSLPTLAAATKRARLPTVSSPSPVDSPLQHAAARSPAKRNRLEEIAVAPSTPPDRLPTFTTPSTPTKLGRRTVHVTGLLTVTVLLNVIKIYDILDGYTVVFTTVLFIIYKVNDYVNVTVNIVLQRLFYTITF